LIVPGLASLALPGIFLWARNSLQIRRFTAMGKVAEPM
jgi:hypothetical protein